MDEKRLDQIGIDLTKDLIALGKLVESGWVLFRHYVVPKHAPELQVSEMQLAFMAGAEYLWSSVLSALDSGIEPTEADLKRMDMIGREIAAWRKILAARAAPTKGSA